MHLSDIIRSCAGSTHSSARIIGAGPTREGSEQDNGASSSSLPDGRKDTGDDALQMASDAAAIPDNADRRLALSFPLKLYDMINDPSQSTVKWNDEGNSFYINSINAFSSMLLPKHFRRKCHEPLYSPLCICPNTQIFSFFGLTFLLLLL